MIGEKLLCHAKAGIETIGRFEMIRLAKRGAAAVALVMLLVMLDVGSASAVRLCAVPGEKAECVFAENIVPKESAIKMALVGKAKFPIGIATVECSASFLGGETTDAGGAGGAVPVEFRILNRFFSECGACEVTPLETYWAGGFFGTGNIDGALYFDHAFKFECGNEECIYDGLNDALVKGGEPAILELYKAFLSPRSGDKKCAPAPEWTATYEVTSMPALYVTEN